MSKMGNKPEKSGELNDFGGREVKSSEEMGGEKHKGPHIHGHEEDRKGRAWHGAKK